MADVKLDLDDDIAKTSQHRIKSKSKKKYWFLLVAILIIGLLLIAIRLNLGGITTTYIGPKIENIPVIKYILPKSSKDHDQYQDYSKEQLINIIDGSQVQEEALIMELENKTQIIEELEQQIKNLKVFEQEHLAFKEEKRKFDEEVASLEPDGFIQFYQQMYPENAQEIYTDLIGTQQLNKEQKKYAATISEMDATSAAKMLENLFQTDMDIILSILSNMETEYAASILEEMDSQIASTIVKQLAP